jgi:hypothetical protein
MNPATIFVLAFIVVLFAVGAFVGRKQQEWKNLLRIVGGVGAFVVAFRVLLSSNLDQWTKVAVMVLACAVVFALNLLLKIRR